MSWPAIQENMFPLWNLAKLSRQYRYRSEGNAQNGLKTRYSRDEDKQLLELRDVQKLPWSSFANAMPGRNQESVKSRYNTLQVGPKAYTQGQIELLQ